MSIATMLSETILTKNTQIVSSKFTGSSSELSYSGYVLDGLWAGIAFIFSDQTACDTISFLDKI